jgi:hypothetical protein
MLSLLMPSAPVEGDRVAGTVVINQDTIPLRHVLARRVPVSKGSATLMTEVTLTAEPIAERDREDGFSIRMAARAGRVAGLQFEFHGDGQRMSARVLSNRLAAPLSARREGAEARPAVWSDTVIAGQFEATEQGFNNEVVTMRADWSARVHPFVVLAEPTAADAEAALAHPAVKAWQAYESAIRRGDRAALVAQAPQAMRDAMQRPEFDGAFAMLRQMTPTVTRILRVREQGAEAIIDAEASAGEGAKPTRGTITMVRDAGGVWSSVRASL